MDTIAGVISNFSKFNFFHVENERRRLGPGFDTTRVSDYILTYHSDPFFAECRAYGRINGHRNAARNKTSNAPGQTRAISRQSKRTSVRGKTPVRGKPSARGRIAPEQKAIGKKEAKNWARASKSESRTTEDNLRKEIAVPCHGYLAVPASPYEAMIKDQYGISEWSRSTADVERRGNDRLPFRALVKTLVKSPTTIKEPRKMLSDLKMLRKMEVFQRDVFARNYKDGLLVDFSVAWTEPYWRADQLRNKGRQLQIRRDKELRQFDEMIEDEGFKTRVRACPAEDTEKKLRPRNEKKSYKV